MEKCGIKSLHDNKIVKRPGQEGNFFRELEDHAGYELRAYTDQAVFCARPGRSVLIKGLKVSE